MNKIPKMSFYAFKIAPERAAVLSATQAAGLLHNCLCKCGNHIDGDIALPYIRNAIPIWAETHTEANYLYYEYGKFINDRIGQMQLIAIKEKTEFDTMLVLKKMILDAIASIQAPLN